MRARNLSSVFLAAVLVIVLFSASASAQLIEPAKLPTTIQLGTKLPVPGSDDRIPDLNVMPAQRLEPPVPTTIPDSPDRTPNGTTVPTGVSSTGGRGSAPVVDPPPPVVQLQLRTPSHVPSGKPVPYKIIVTNTSQAKALNVKVRMPAPTGAAAVTKCEPLADGMKGPIPPQGFAPGQLEWTMPSLQKGESKTFEVELMPTADSKQVAAKAYVGFEYGARVETVVDKPKVSVKKTATPEAAVGELITVRVNVTNTGSVPVPNARLIESVPPDVEVRGDGEASKTATAGQREWKLSSIAPGQTKTVTYQMLARKGGDVPTKSFVDCETGILESAAADTTTKVVIPALRLDFTGPPKAEPRSPATYTAVVRNVGTMPLSNVRLSIDVPDDLIVLKVTNGCRTDRGKRTWVIPKLSAGESQEFRVGVEPDQGVSGRRSLTASARDGNGRLDDQTREATTEFVGRAHLNWKPSFDSARVSIGRQGTITVAVKNHGAETDKGVRLQVMIPPEVRVVDSGPVKATLNGNTLIFPPQAVGPGKSIEFTVNYEGRTAGQGQFRLLLEGESLEKALTKDQPIEIER